MDPADFRGAEFAFVRPVKIRAKRGRFTFSHAYFGWAVTRRYGLTVL